MRIALLYMLALVVLTGAAFAQTTTNPNISVIGDLRAYSHDDPDREDEQETLNLSDPQMELFLDGYLNPYVTATATIGWHPGADAEIEEVYATVVRGLPWRLNLRAGKYRLEFGRLNPIHPHAYSFIQSPLPHEAFFGEHGLNDVAVRLSWAPPTGAAFTEFMGAVLKGDALMGHDHEHEHEHEGEEAEEEEEDDSRTDLGVLGRVTTSLATSEHGELAFGASVVNSVYEKHLHEGEEEPEQMKALIGGLDIKYKWTKSRSQQLQIEAEALMRRDEIHDGDHLNSYGGYGYIDYRLSPRFNVGTIGEFVRQEELHEDEEEPEIHQTDTWRVGLFAGFTPIEETSLVRLVGHYTMPDEGDNFWEATLQLVFSLGPHKPHNF